ncbi:MAG TPA: metal ABC transporter permease [Candidatus Limnocylindrales bacterium]|nr:metal ABC transporter permease [Candidatus Limnocylindrales bacterium]
MTVPQLEILLIAAVTAVACALVGVFLVLRRMAMMSDAISHAILFGIVLAFFVTKDLASPFLAAAAALTGILTVSLVELVNRTGRVREDAAIGLVFPALFSMGVILIARHAGSVHLDVDSVLLGELAFAPFNRFEALGYDLGPKGLYLMSGILALDVLFIRIFYKELKLATFDPGLAAVLGFTPGILHYALMALVSVTAVGAFDAAGSILVVALMIAPPATAYLLVDRLSRMLALSALFGVASAVSGYWIAHVLDASIAGSMASMSGLLFGLTFLFAPGRGFVAIVSRRRRQRLDFAQTMLAVHLYNHEGLAEALRENTVAHLHERLKWEPSFAERAIEGAERRGLVTRLGVFLHLTDKGRSVAKEAMVR